MKTSTEYVEAMLEDSIRCCVSAGPLRNKLLVAGIQTGQDVCITYDTQRALCEALTYLQSSQLPFADALGGWTPVAVLAHLREEGQLHGPICTSIWRGPDQPEIGIG
ncbi:MULTISPECIES: hypothetical protein [Xanthomonas]|uniref:hypothetical protein n=1 Tax=Xanthomonas TaxID=338 RepID=UPI000A68145E|nr:MULTISPECIES: hypothetical protein [Xanthomonas]